jgi:hypothetical protein
MIFFNPYLFSKISYNGYITSNLIGYWDFGLPSSYYGANALVIHDLSGNGLDMTYALTGSHYPPPYTSNGYGVSVQVGGPFGASSTQNGYMANVAYTQTFSSTGFTFESALTPTSIYASGNQNQGVCITNGGVSPYTYTSIAYGGGWFLDTYNSPTENTTSYYTKPVPIANQMVHVTATVNSSGAYNIYINGTLIGSGTTGYVFPNSVTPSFLTLGSLQNSIGYGQASLVNAARVYNAPLSAANVWTNYGNVYQNLTYKTYTPTAPSYKTYVTSNLLGYWDFTNSTSYPGSGAAVTDLSGNNIGLTISGTPSFNSTGALSFNPSSTSYAASSAVALNLSSGFTLESLVYFTSISNNPITIAYSTSSYGNAVYQYVSVFGYIYGSGSGTYGGNFISASVITTGQWYHIVSVFTSTTSTSCVHYVNGVAVANIITSDFSSFPNNPASTQIYLGNAGLNTGEYVNGKVALGRIYNTALTAAQVQENYVSAFSKLTGTVPYVMTGLLGYWDFADSRSSSLAGSALNDLGPNGYNLTFGTSPTYQTTGALAAITSATSSASSAITPSLNFTASGFTFECVANLYQYASLSNVISYVSGSTSIGLTFLPTAINVVGYGTWAGSTNAAGGCYSSNTFAHVCVVINSTVATAASYYINGALVATQSTGLTNFLAFPNGTASGTLIIGATPNNTVSGFNGRIAMVRVYGIPLSASQVRQNYSAAFSKLASNPYLIPPPLNQSLAFPPALNFAASSSVNLTYISETAQSYGNGQYICISSSNGGGNRGASSAFGATNLWFSNTLNQNYLTTSPFTESNSTSNAAINGIYGEWVGATLPVQIIPTGFSFYTYGTYTPTQFSIFGSNVNAVGWATLGSFGPITQPNIVGTFQYYQLPSTTTSYNTLVMLVTAGNSATQVCVQGLQFYGTPVSSLAVPPGLPYWTSNAQYTTTNLIGYWDTALTASSSGTGSKILYDLSGNGNNMVLSTAPTYTTSPPSFIVSSAPNTCNTYVTSSSIPGITMEILINLNGIAFSGVRMFNIGTNANPTGVTLTITSTGSAVTSAVYSGTSGNLTGTLTTPSQIPATGWVHLVFALTSGSTTSCYINTFAATVTISSVAGASNFTLGTEWELGHNQYNDTGVPGASIAMARVYSTSLTSAQVAQNYLHCLNKLPTNAYSLPLYATNGLLNYYDFSKAWGSGTTVNDLAGSVQLTINSPAGSSIETSPPSLYCSNSGFTTYLQNTSPYTTVSSLTATTIEVLFKPDSTSGAQYTVNLGYGVSGGLLCMNGLYNCFQNPGQNITITTGSTVNTITWSHVVFVFTGGGASTIFLNGVKQTITTTGSITTPFSFTRMNFGMASQGIYGRFAMARIYNRGLSDAEILVNYTSARAAGLYGI